jgi:hypothetical protein
MMKGADKAQALSILHTIDMSAQHRRLGEASGPAFERVFAIHHDVQACIQHLTPRTQS